MNWIGEPVKYLVEMGFKATKKNDLKENTKQLEKKLKRSYGYLT